MGLVECQFSIVFLLKLVQCIKLEVSSPLVLHMFNLQMSLPIALVTVVKMATDVALVGIGAMKPTLLPYPTT